MAKGVLPFKYLGISVSSKRCSVMDCECLIDKILERIRSLGSKHLSYAGRLVLIKAVLSNLHSYWGRIFLLPKTVLSRLNWNAGGSCGMVKRLKAVQH